MPFEEWPAGEGVAPVLKLVEPRAKTVAKRRRRSAPDVELIDLYGLSQRRRNLSPKTVTVVRRSLVSFSKAFPDGFASVSEEAIEQWLDSRNLSPKTRYGWISQLDTFYGWAVSAGHLAINPAAGIRRPRLRRALPRPISDKDLRQALASADPMMRCWLLLAAFEGLRCQEIAGLEREDVDEAHGRLRVVHGKGDKERMLPLHPDVLAALQALPMPTSGPVFHWPAGCDPRVSPGSRLTADHVSHEVATYLHSLGSTATAHTLRHYFATSIYRSTRDLLLTQELLGHASPAMTAVYAASDPKHAAPAVEGLKLEDE